MPGSTPGKERLVLGLDVGGTWTRALLATTAGRRIGSGRSAGANPATHGVTVAADRIAEALAGAMRISDPAAVAACVVGLAGASQYAADPDTVRAFEQIWKAAGLTCPVRVVSDVAVAFAAGTPRPVGSVLVAGTGAVAAQIRDREPVAIHGGFGWLLGDDGSGFWIGRQAVRATLSALDGRAPMSALPKLILDRYALGEPWQLSPAGGADRPPDGGGADRPSPDGSAIHSPQRRPMTALIREVNRRPPISLAELAPLVVRAHGQGDPAAARILTEAAGLLMADLEPFATADDGPIVLAGGLLAAGGPVRDLVASAILQRWPGADVRTALDGSAAAAWLAAQPLLTEAHEWDALHPRLMPALGQPEDVDAPNTLV
jgi:N-acetylglucosamine kinase-like BadF-type ATPase